MAREGRGVVNSAPKNTVRPTIHSFHPTMARNPTDPDPDPDPDPGPDPSSPKRPSAGCGPTAPVRSASLPQGIGAHCLGIRAPFEQSAPYTRGTVETGRRGTCGGTPPKSSIKVRVETSHRRVLKPRPTTGSPGKK